MTTEEKILNKGLEFAMEFGSNWLQPIQSRLAETFPDLQKEKLNEYDSICRQAMRDGHQFIYKTLEAAAGKKRTIGEKEVSAQLTLFIHKKYPWIDSQNLKGILSQGYYYAWKDGFR